jgi:glycosyltransferase involved in cell wall biosynthesis
VEPHWEAMPGNPPVSVVIPTYRRPEMLETCLRALSLQDMDKAQFEVIVVDDGSGEETCYSSVAEGCDDLTVKRLTQPTNLGPAAARNRGIAEARGELILFLDDDIAASPSLVRTHLELHQGRDHLLGVVGTVDWHPELQVTDFMKWLDTTSLQFSFKTSLAEGPVARPWEALYTCNLSMSARILSEVGGFDERFPFPAFEDIELGVRLQRKGFHLEYRPQALAWNVRPITLEDFCRRTALVAESAVLLREAQPDLPFELPDVTANGRRRLVRWVLRRVLPAAAVLPFERLRARYFLFRVHDAYRTAGGRT